MLRTFTVGCTFNKLEAVLHVDCQKKDAEVVILYDRRIRRIEAVPFHEVSEPQLADRWFSKSASVEHGSWLEFHATMCARDPKWLVNEEPPPRGVVVDGRHVEVLDEHATLAEQVRDGKPASHPDFYPPHMGGKAENWPTADQHPPKEST